MSDVDFYPEKPILATKDTKNNWSVTLSSVILFIATFLMLFDEHVLFVLYLILVLVIHEFGHFIFMRKFNYKNVKMLFVPLMGAFVQGEKNKYSQKQSILVVLGGPLPGIILGILLFLVASQFQSKELLQIALLFYALNVFNLLPIDPLDGGQLIRYLFMTNSDVLLFVFSLISSIIMILLGFLLDSYLVMGFGFLMGIRVRNLQKKMTLYKNMEEEGLEFSKSYEDLTNKEYHLLRRYSVENIPLLQKYFNVTEQVDEHFIASYVKSILRIPVKKDITFIVKSIIVLLWLLVLVLIPVGVVIAIKSGYIDMNWYRDVLEF